MMNNNVRIRENEKRTVPYSGAQIKNVQIFFFHLKTY